MFINVNIKMK